MKHTSSEHALQMLEVGVQYRLPQLISKCTQLILTDEEVLYSDEFLQLSPEVTRFVKTSAAGSFPADVLVGIWRIPGYS